MSHFICKFKKYYLQPLLFSIISCHLHKKDSNLSNIFSYSFLQSVLVHLLLITPPNNPHQVLSALHINFLISTKYNHHSALRNSKFYNINTQLSCYLITYSATQIVRYLILHIMLKFKITFYLLRHLPLFDAPTLLVHIFFLLYL